MITENRKIALLFTEKEYYQNRINYYLYRLEENVNSLLSVWSGLSSHYFPSWKLKWHDIQKENPYLIFKLPQNAKYLLDSFDEDLNKFANLSNQKLPKLKKENEWLCKFAR